MSSTPTTLALPVGDSELPARSFTLAGLVGGAAGLAMIAALASAYIGLRSAAEEWPPEGFEIPGFSGVMLTLTALMAATFAAWAPIADGRGERRQAAAGLSLAAFIGLCLVNGIWYVGTQLDLGAASSSFATVSYALMGGVGAFLGAGVIGLLAALAKVLGRQTGPAYPGTVRAAVWFWELALVGWIVVWATMFLLK